MTSRNSGRRRSFKSDDWRIFIAALIGYLINGSSIVNLEPLVNPLTSLLVP